MTYATTYDTDDRSQEESRRIMSWRDAVKLRRWVVRKHEQGWSLDEIAANAHAARSICYR